VTGGHPGLTAYFGRGTVELLERISGSKFFDSFVAR
jgi:hypothetical protein